MENRERNKYNRRLTGLGAVVVIVFLVLGINLWRLQIVKASYYMEMAEGNVMKTVTTSAVRGDIIDKNGVVLVKSIPRFALVLDWTDLQAVNKDWRSAVEELAGFIKPYWPYPNESKELITEDIFVMIRNQQLESFKPVVVLEDVSDKLQAVIAEHSNELPGVSIEAVPERFYTKGTLLGQVLGYVREISGEELEQLNSQSGEESNSNDYEYSAGDLVGKMGVEKSYDTWLRGVHGINKIGIDSNARPVVKETIQEAQPGYTLQLTIDSGLQAVVENKLNSVIEDIQKVHPNASAGAAVVIDVKTGKILAMASRPYMDPNDLIGVISDETAEKYFRSEDAASFNRALTGLYPPGSTFKMITGMAALEKKLVTPSDNFYDSMSSLGPYAIQLQGIQEWGGNNFGAVNIYRGLAMSSNIYFQIIGRKVFEQEPEYIKKVANEFGLGVK
ncbi:MAG: penicillin-binding transpeptidase domain-containing protein, partial [Eubacteriales bacterium]